MYLYPTKSSKNDILFAYLVIGMRAARAEVRARQYNFEVGIHFNIKKAQLIEFLGYTHDQTIKTHLRL